MKVCALPDQLRDRQIHMLRARRQCARLQRNCARQSSDYDQVHPAKETRIDRNRPPLRSTDRYATSWICSIESRRIARYLISHRRGRPAGQINHPDAVQFLMLLLVIVRSFEGDLHFDKNRPNKRHVVTGG